MPTRDVAWPAGTPCWLDYSAADLDAAKAFYTDLFVWTYTGGEQEYGGYLVCRTKDRAAAGMMPAMNPAQPPAWTTYFATEDADASAAAVKAAGGTVVAEPMDVGPLGRMAIVLDNQGQVFGLWQAAEHTGVEVYNEPGALVWNEQASPDPDASRSFYATVFGFHFESVEGAAGYTTFDTGGNPLGGLGAQTDGLPGGWTCCFSVASTDDAVAITDKGGGTVLMPAQDSPFGRFAVLTDPWGAHFSVMQAPAG